MKRHSGKRILAELVSVSAADEGFQVFVDFIDADPMRDIRVCKRAAEDGDVAVEYRFDLIVRGKKTFRQRSYVPILFRSTSQFEIR